MNKVQLEQVRDLLGFSNVELGKALGFSHSKYQCRQINNLMNGQTEVIKETIVLSLECLARRQDKLKEFDDIVKN